MSDLSEVANIEEVQEEIVKVLPDYKNIPIERGQYWRQGNDVLIAFVIAVNEYGVLYQNKVTSGPVEGTTVFDFESGQAIRSIGSFREMLEKVEATIFEARGDLVSFSLEVYKKHLGDGLIPRPKELPRNEVDYQDLLDFELFTEKKRIVPPPLRYRNKKAFHWLKAGESGAHTVCKLWDPEAKLHDADIPGNWVFASGAIDTTAQIGYVNDWLALAEVEFDAGTEESFDELSVRIVDFLKSKHFMFDTTKVSGFLKKLDPNLVSRETINLKENVFTFILPDTLSGDEALEIKYPVYDFTYYLKHDPGMTADLILALVYNGQVKTTLEVKGVMNFEFIPSVEWKIRWPH